MSSSKLKSIKDFCCAISTPVSWWSVNNVASPVFITVDVIAPLDKAPENAPVVVVNPPIGARFPACERVIIVAPVESVKEVVAVPVPPTCISIFADAPFSSVSLFVLMSPRAMLVKTLPEVITSCPPI